MRQVHRKEVDPALNAADDTNSFAKVDLGMARRMNQRHEHLLRPLTPTGYIILHYRDAARETEFVAKIRFAVCRCFLGRDRSSPRMQSMIATNGSSFGRTGGFVRR